tara:strand:- start:67 stop:708 length:642 start_codon:yes stop_codon:yes gene_type:complete
VSSVNHWARYKPDTNVHRLSLKALHKIQRDVIAKEKFDSNEHAAIKLEDLGKKEILRSLADWLGINYHKTMKVSTFGGLFWHGDRLSSGEKTSLGFSQSMTNNRWEEILSRKDKYILNYVMHDRLVRYNYAYKNIRFIDNIFVPILILLPMRLEKLVWSIKYMIKMIRNRGLLGFIYQYSIYIYTHFRRVLLLTRLYLNVLRKKQFPVKVIKS